MQPASHGSRVAQRRENPAKNLQAADLGIGIVTIAHTNENGDPKYCKMVRQRAGVVIELHRDLDADSEVDKNTLKLYVTKNRPCSTVGKGGELVFNLDTFTLNEKSVGF